MLLINCNIYFIKLLKEEIQCQSELADLIPQIEEANMISIALDKKIRYKALAVSPDARLVTRLF
jgi:hypothetical protein